MWATSIGSTFAHSPVCGVRKSGIPDGTEIPAPGSARRGRPGCSLPLELRRALPEEGGDPLARVLARERRDEAPLLGLDALVEVAGVRHALDLLERDRRLAGELAAPAHRLVEQLVVGHDPVHEA